MSRSSAKWLNSLFKLCSISLMLPALFSTSAKAEVDRVYSSNNHNTQLVELYTSQGCSSCPPADHWLTQWKQRPQLWSELIPVAFHVDYWDWIGWQDRFASPAFGLRQRTHKKQGAIKSVYTPGFVVDGKEWRGWFEGRPLPPPLHKQGTLTAELNNQRITLRYQNEEQPLTSNLQVQVVLLGFDLETPVLRGENTNRTLKEDFVVLWHTTADDNSSWSFALPDRSSLPTQKLGFAAWTTLRGSGRPLQVVGGRL